MLDRDFVDTPSLLMLIAANGTPVVVGWLLGTRYAAPIDGNRVWRDGRALLGAHKTWRGLVTGIVAGGLAGALLTPGFRVGAAFGALALGGDLISSFLKRRFGFRNGQSVPLLDQLPEALLPLLVLQGALGLGALEIAGTCLLFAVLDALTSRLRT